MPETQKGFMLGKGDREVCLLPGMANRHGLIAGATGTGKTITLRIMLEQFSRMGVPSFVADVKGDLSGLCMEGEKHPKVAARAKELEMKDFPYQGYPVVFWDVFGEQGHPVRTTVSEMGPLLMGRILNLNDTQGGLLHALFKMADDHGLLLLDMKDLRALLQFAAENAASLRPRYGNLSTASLGAIQRNLIALEEQGGDRLFGEPALVLEDLLQTDASGRGVINLLAADRLMQSPRTYAAFFLWVLAELFEQLPEVGDPPQPRLMLFLDEAHLLFDGTPKILVEKIEQVVRLIRSKGVGVFFITQTPLDLPQSILGQLGHRVQHALRAFTPKDQRSVRASAETFRPNPRLKVMEALTELGVGEALASVLDEGGRPTMVERVWIRPPESRLAPLTAEERRKFIRSSILFGHYEQSVDRESAYEQLMAKANQFSTAPAGASSPSARRPQGRETIVEGLLGSFVKSAARSIGTQMGRQIFRGLLGSLTGGPKR